MPLFLYGRLGDTEASFKLKVKEKYGYSINTWTPHAFSRVRKPGCFLQHDDETIEVRVSEPFRGVARETYLTPLYI